MTDLATGTDQEALSVAEACRRLGGIHRATFYRLKFFKTRRVALSEGGRRKGVMPSDVALYLHLQRNKRSA